MRKNDLFKITVLRWFEYNPKAKKSYKATLIQHSLIIDAKINALPLSNKWLFINLLLICGDHANDTITLTRRQLNDILTTREGVENALHRLESYQLVSYEKTSLIEVKEEKRREYKGIEKNIITSESSDPEKSEPEKQLNLEPEKKSYPHRPNKVQSRGCIDEFALDETCKSRLENVTTRAQKAWLIAYPNAEWICFEIRKAHAWCETNSHKAPKDFGRFMNSWLNKAFENYRKGLNSKYKTNAQRNSDALQEMKERVERGEL